jgi:hypothetical protein
LAHQKASEGHQACSERHKVALIELDRFLTRPEPEPQYAPWNRCGPGQVDGPINPAPNLHRDPTLQGSPRGTPPLHTGVPVVVARDVVRLEY